jgi:hypothetical protein
MKNAGPLNAAAQREATEDWGMTMSGAGYEILIDGKTRSYRDTKAVALEAAQYLKLRNLTSVVTVRDVKSGEVTPIDVTAS